MALSSEETDSYTAKIDRILSQSDLNTVSAKKIRRDLQQELDRDLSHQKNEINDLIKQRFDFFAAKEGIDEPQSPQQPVAFTNGTSNHSHNHVVPAPPAASPSVKHSVESDELSDVADERPPKKKPKKTTPLDEDAAYAARLQAEENSRARPTRGNGTTKKRQVTKKATSPKKKSSNKIKADDDSDLDSGSGHEKSKKRSGAFHKPQHLSPPLAQLLGEDVLSRPQTVKGIWNYVKTRQLQNPSDKRQIMCDDALRAVFKKDSVNMFAMNKLLSTQLTPVDEAV